MTEATEFQPRSYIHYNPERTDYTVTEQELNRLCEGGRSIWKDACLVSVSLGIPAIINAVEETISQPEFSLTLPMFLNYLLGALGLALGLVFLIAWRRSRFDTQSLVGQIKRKPKIELPSELVRYVGPLSESPSKSEEGKGKTE